MARLLSHLPAAAWGFYGLMWRKEQELRQSQRAEETTETWRPW
jgi:hypothetical protein